MAFSKPKQIEAERKQIQSREENKKKDKKSKWIYY